ncbi:MAG: relaxase/mobilization nuclease domain-containing protein [Crinalium sp.]
MLAKVVATGSNPSGLLSYLMDSEKEYSLYGGNIAGQTYGEIMAEWKAISQQNPRTDKDTKHVTLSPHHSDRLTPEQWLDIGEFMVNGLGYTDNLWLMIKHKPTESQQQKYPDAQPHVHLMIHTFECDNFTRVNDWQDQTKAEALTRDIESLWDLYQVAPSQEASQSAPTTGQKRRMMREQEDFEKGLRATPPDEPTLQKLERIVIDATSDRPDVITFVGRLQHADVDVHPTIIGDEMKGFAFEYEGFRCRGSQLKNCSWKKLQSLRGVTFNSEQDLPILQAVAAGEVVQLEPFQLQIQAPQLVPTRSKLSAASGSATASDSIDTGKSNISNERNTSKVKEIDNIELSTAAYVDDSKELEKVEDDPASQQWQSESIQGTSPSRPSSRITEILGSLRNSSLSIDRSESDNRGTADRDRAVAAGTGTNPNPTSKDDDGVGDTDTNSQSINQELDEQLRRIAFLQQDTAARLGELEAEHQRRKPKRIQKIEAVDQQSSRRAQQSESNKQGAYQPSQKPSPGIELD